MVRRDFLVRSTLPPPLVLDALASRAREWRESAVPQGLRAHGVHGVQIRIDGPRFRMDSEPKWTDRFELRCRGTVSPDGSGSVIEGRTRQDNPPLWVGQIFAGILAINLLRAPSWTALANGVALLTCYAAFAALAVVFLPQHARHAAEAAEFERIVESAAWPPGTTSPRPPGKP